MQQITITLQVGEGEPQTASFGLPGIDDAGVGSDPVDTVMPPPIDGMGEAAGEDSDMAPPPDFDMDEDDYDEDEASDDDDDDNVAPPEV